MFFCSVCFKKTHGEEEFKRRTLQEEKKDHVAAAVAGEGQTTAASKHPASTAALIMATGILQGGQANPGNSGGAAGKKEAKAAAANSEHTAAAQASGEGGGGGKEEGGEPASKKMAPSRCMSCKKKVGLLGFHCRCGGTYCSEHRYSDKHECTYDYKTHGRDQVSIFCAASFARHHLCSCDSNFSGQICPLCAQTCQHLLVARGRSELLPDTTAPKSGIWHESLRSNKLKSEMCVMVSVLESRLTSKITFL